MNKMRYLVVGICCCIIGGCNNNRSEVCRLEFNGKNISSSEVLLGRKIGTGNVLIYNNAPSNALFLLKDLSRGKETRIFTYKDDKQIWW